MIPALNCCHDLRAGRNSTLSSQLTPPIYENELSRRLLIRRTGMTIKTVGKYFELAIANLELRD